MPIHSSSNYLNHSTLIKLAKVLISANFCYLKVKPEFSDIPSNPTHFPGPLVCRIRQVPLYIEITTLIDTYIGSKLPMLNSAIFVEKNRKHKTS
jgi:hypothetical protein